MAHTDCAHICYIVLQTILHMLQQARSASPVHKFAASCKCEVIGNKATQHHLGSRFLCNF